MAFNNSTEIFLSVESEETSEILKAFQAICVSACIVANIPGLFFLFVIITYLMKKSEGQKTVFDDLVIDSIVPVGLYSVIITLVMFLGLFPVSMPYWVALLTALPTYIVHDFLFVSCTVTLIVKLLFITQGDTMYGFKDLTIRIASFAIKIGMLSIVVVIDQVVEGSKNPPAFDLLKTGHESPLKLGLGSQMNLGICIIATLCILFYAKSLNDMDGIKRNLEIFGFFGATCFSIILIFTILFQASVLSSGAGYFFGTIEIIVLVFILPIMTINNNQNLRNHLESYFPDDNAVYPIND